MKNYLAILFFLFSGSISLTAAADGFPKTLTCDSSMDQGFFGPNEQGTMFFDLEQKKMTITVKGYTLPIFDQTHVAGVIVKDSALTIQPTLAPGDESDTNINILSASNGQPAKQVAQLVYNDEGSLGYNGWLEADLDFGQQTSIYSNSLTVNNCKLTY